MSVCGFCGSTDIKLYENVGFDILLSGDIEYQDLEVCQNCYAWRIILRCYGPLGIFLFSSKSNWEESNMPPIR